MSDAEYRAYDRLARAKQVTLSEWVRQSLRSSRLAEPGRGAAWKLAAVRAAAAHALPTADIDDMLREIARGAAPRLPE